MLSCSSKESRRWEVRHLLFVGGELVANNRREGEGHADEGWVVDMHDALCDTVVKSSSHPTRMV